MHASNLSTWRQRQADHGEFEANQVYKVEFQDSQGFTKETLPQKNKT